MSGGSERGRGLANQPYADQAVRRAVRVATDGVDGTQRLGGGDGGSLTVPTVVPVALSGLLTRRRVSRGGPDVVTERARVRESRTGGCGRHVRPTPAQPGPPPSGMPDGPAAPVASVGHRRCGQLSPGIALRNTQSPARSAPAPAAPGRSFTQSEPSGPRRVLSAYTTSRPALADAAAGPGRRNVSW